MTPSDPPTKRDGSPPPTSPHTAVIYFHGMGNQRRYEEISRLVDCLDKYAYANRQRTGRLFEIEPEIEPPRGPLKRDVTCVRTKRVFEKPADSKSDAKPSCRAWFYEVFWAPLTAGGVPALQVIRWILRQIPYPVTAVRTPWRLRSRLRRSHLFKLRGRLSDAQKELFPTLLRDYDAFDGPEAWRQFPDGGFASFRSFLQSRHKGDSKLDDYIALAARWRRSYLMAELLYLGVLITIAVAVGLAAAAAAFLAFWTLRALSGLPIPGMDPESFKPTVSNVAATVGVVGTILGITGFLREYLADVQMWTTYQETDVKYQKRNDILEAATGLLQHVLADDRCKRVVIVAHSLGTAVAFDSLLQLGRFERARPKARIPWQKMDLLITMGSPIDKIHYFFESYAGRYRRYNRLIEELRGDICALPFAKNRKPHIHWINIWDEADVISGSLETPANSSESLTVDNYEISTRGFPLPGASHSAYFEDNRVLGVLFDAIYDGRYSFAQLPSIDGKGKDYASQNVGPGKGLARTRFFQALWLALPWTVLGALISLGTGAVRLHWWFKVAIAAIVLVSIAGYILGRGWKPRQPIC